MVYLWMLTILWQNKINIENVWEWKRNLKKETAEISRRPSENRRLRELGTHTAHEEKRWEVVDT